MTGSDEHNVARSDLETLGFQSRAEFAWWYGVARRQAVNSLELNKIDQDTSREEHADVFDAEFLKPIGIAELTQLETVVEDVFPVDVCSDVPEPVELRADLADFSAEQLVVRHDLIGAGRRPRRQTGNRQAEMALAGQRHPVFVDAAQLVNAALLNQVACFEHFIRRESVGSAALVIRTPFRRPPLRADRRVIRQHGSEAQQDQDDGSSQHEKRKRAGCSVIGFIESPF